KSINDESFPHSFGNYIMLDFGHFNKKGENLIKFPFFHLKNFSPIHPFGDKWGNYQLFFT
ncbi:hypothetical protein, partial [Dubosiella newyorkensis]|uniref:hypothetical protein n=1 Tax=Dubosiella newyorkensis TaxID=1862672 RepID=UPI002731E283